jgi:hypothetical protein
LETEELAEMNSTASINGISDGGAISYTDVPSSHGETRSGNAVLSLPVPTGLDDVPFRQRCPGACEGDFQARRPAERRSFADGRCEETLPVHTP